MPRPNARRFAQEAIDKLKKDRASLDTRIAELKAFIVLSDELLKNGKVGGKRAKGSNAKKVSGRTRSQVSRGVGIDSLVLNVMEKHPQIVFTAPSMRHEIRTMHGVSIKPQSISATFSKLTIEGRLVRVKLGAYRLAPKGVGYTPEDIGAIRSGSRKFMQGRVNRAEKK